MNIENLKLDMANAAGDMSKYKGILDYLTTAEGGKIHYNSTEKDITSGRGIYRYNNKGIIWDYVDTVAKSIGIIIPSVSWDKDELDKINKNVDPKIMEYLEYLFYKQY